MNEKIQFSRRLALLMEQGGYPFKASVLEREFNQRYLGKPITLQAACRWIKGETLPTQEKVVVLAEWLGTEPHLLRYGDRVPQNQVREAKGSWTARSKPVSKSDLDIWESFIKLPASQKKVLKDIIQTFNKDK